MPGVIPDVCDSDRTPVVPTWYHAGVLGPCGCNPKLDDRSAEHGVAADRFAREIVRFLMAFLGALAAAEHQAVRPLYECSSKPTVVVTRCFGRCGTFCLISAS
jgi:hypothetical protein